MSSTGKILGALALFGGAYGLSRLLKTGNTGKKISVTVMSANKPKIQNGALRLSVNVAIDNPTDDVLDLKKPTLKAYYNGNEVGNSIPSDEHINIIANDRTTISGINIQIPFIKLGALALQLVTGNVPKMTLEIAVHTVANGIPYTDRQSFDL